MNKLNDIKNMSLDDKVMLYKIQPSNTILNYIIQDIQCKISRILYKNKNVQDAQDILQNYFISNLNNAINKYNSSLKIGFFNYIKKVLLYRIYNQSYMIVNKYDSLNDNIIYQDSDNYSNIDNECGRDIIVKETRKIIFGIDNIKYRNALIIYLFIPYKKLNINLSDISKYIFGGDKYIHLYYHRALKVLLKKFSKKYLFDIIYAAKNFQVSIFRINDVIYKYFNNDKDIALVKYMLGEKYINKNISVNQYIILINKVIKYINSNSILILRNNKDTNYLSLLN